MNTPLTAAALADMTKDELIAAYKKSRAILDAAFAAYPDAELISICDRHSALMDAVNVSPDDDEAKDSPVWRAYNLSRLYICEAEPQTLDGILAIARAAKAEARQPNGQDECGEYGDAAAWAWKVLNSLLRIENGNVNL